MKVLYKYNAPHAVLEKYLKFIDNLEKRLELAKKLSCHTVVIDVRRYFYVKLLRKSLVWLRIRTFLDICATRGSCAADGLQSEITASVGRVFLC